MYMDSKTSLYLAVKAAEIRRLVVDAVYYGQSGHPGGSLSCSDIIAYLYFHAMNASPESAADPCRDRFVLSKGHCCPALYSALALKGYIPKEAIRTFRHIDSNLQGHPDMKKTPGVDMTTGSLGQGFSAACGMAKAAKITGRDYHVYALIGDGESQEGQIWEAAMFAAHYGLDNLTAFLDFNGLQIDGEVRKVMNPTPLDEKFKAFGWRVRVVDGHDFAAIDDAVSNTPAGEKPSPLMIICNTVKGKGVSFMENNYKWHGKAPNDAEYAVAAAELDKTLTDAVTALEASEKAGM